MDLKKEGSNADQALSIIIVKIAGPEITCRDPSGTPAAAGSDGELIPRPMLLLPLVHEARKWSLAQIILTVASHHHDDLPRRCGAMIPRPGLLLPLVLLMWSLRQCHPGRGGSVPSAAAERGGWGVRPRQVAAYQAPPIYHPNQVKSPSVLEGVWYR